MNQARRIDIHPASVQALRIEMRSGGKPLAAATAFVVRSAAGPLLITSRRNLAGHHRETGEPLHEGVAGRPDSVVVWHHQQGALGRWIQLSYALHDRHGAPTWMEHPALGPAADIAALRLISAPVRYFPFELADPNLDVPVAPAATVSVIGFPPDVRVGGYFPVWAAGFVASDPGADVDGLPMFLVDCRTRSGLSGAPVVAPVVAASGAGPSGADAAASPSSPVRLLGLYGGHVNGQSDIARVWKTSALLELARSVRPRFDVDLHRERVRQPSGWLDMAIGAATGEY